MKNLYIIGAGMGHIDDLTVTAQNIIKKCGKVFGSDRLFHQYECLNKNITAPKFADIIPLIEQENEENIAVLVSGDTGFFSLSKNLVSKFDDKFNIEIIPGISSKQYLLSKLKISYENVHVVSMHGRNNKITGSISYNEYTFILTGGKAKAHNIISDIYNAGLHNVYVSIGENMNLENEKIITCPIKDALDYEFCDLTVLLVHNKDYVNPNKPLKDNDFIRGKAPMTKEDIRWLLPKYLDIQENDIVYDIGAGTGSCAFEFAGHAKNGLVYAFEKEEEAYNLILENKKNLKRYNVECIKGTAPDILSDIEPADKVFIGGSSGKIEDIYSVIYEKNSNAVITVTAITIETLYKSKEAFKKYDIEPEIVCINSAKSKKAGPYHMMMGNNPVYIITGRK